VALLRLIAFSVKKSVVRFLDLPDLESSVARPSLQHVIRLLVQTLNAN